MEGSTGMSTQERDLSSQAYWKKNLRIIMWCLIIWAVVSLGFGVILAPVLNNFQMGGYPLGFWFAHQGAIYIFIILIFFYAWRMNRLDKEYNLDEQ
jgi:putative solute:sodium symporter small subunit